MKKELVLLVVIAAVLAGSLVVVSWYFGHQNGRLATAQETTSRRVTNVESRLVPLEEDFRGRKAVRSLVFSAIRWIRTKLGL